MVSILTGDIIKSRNTNPDIWMPRLKEALGRYGKQPGQWEIFRGDSFQLQVDDPAVTFEAAMYIKATIKCIEKMDVRIAIGIGTKDYKAERITESAGTAFEYSGSLFESLKKMKQNLAIRSGRTNFDEEMNLYFKLALIAMNKWTENSAIIVVAMLENAEKSQQEIGELLHIRQNAVSGRLRRAHYHEMMELDKMYRKKVMNIS